METFLDFFHLVQGVRRGSQIENSQGISQSGSPPEDIFLRSHPNIQVKCGLPLYQMDTFQGIFNLGRGGDGVYEMKMSISRKLKL